jgi:hypothetical protein
MAKTGKRQREGEGGGVRKKGGGSGKPTGGGGSGAGLELPGLNVSLSPHMSERC